MLSNKVTKIFILVDDFCIDIEIKKHLIKNPSNRIRDRSFLRKSGEFVANMERVLDVYKGPYDKDYPVVCMDESPKQLIEHSLYIYNILIINKIYNQQTVNKLSTAKKLLTAKTPEKLIT